MNYLVRNGNTAMGNCEHISEVKIKSFEDIKEIQRMLAHDFDILPSQVAVISYQLIGKVRESYE